MWLGLTSSGAEGLNTGLNCEPGFDQYNNTRRCGGGLQCASSMQQPSLGQGSEEAHEEQMAPQSPHLTEVRINVVYTSALRGVCYTLTLNMCIFHKDIFLYGTSLKAKDMPS